MVLLTTLLTPIVILASFSITERIKPYMILFMLLETGMLGVFLIPRPAIILCILGSWSGADVLPDQPVGQ